MYAALAPKPEEKKSPAASEPAAGPELASESEAGAPAGAPHFLRLVGGAPPPMQRRESLRPEKDAAQNEDVLPLQGRLEVNKPGDAWEQEADGVASAVMRKTEPAVLPVTRPAGPPRIQRDPQPGASPSGVPASMPGPNASVPPGKAIPFEGVVLSPDSAGLRQQLEQMAATKGEAAASTFAWRFINMDWAQKASLEAEYGKELVGEIQVYLREEINRLEFDNQEFLKLLEQKATVVTRELLANSKTQIEKELAHYGITEKQTEDPAGGPPTKAYDMSNEAAGKGLQVAAGELAAKRRMVDEVGRQSIAAREAVEKAAQANPFLIPPALQEEAESSRKVWQQAEKEFTDLANGKQAEFPILAAYSAGPGAAGRLEQLAQQSSGSLAGSLGQTAHERLANIQTVESELGGRFNVWSQQRMLDLAMRQMNATPMQSRVAADNVAKVKADAESSKMLFGLLAIGLGLLAAIPTGGTTLLAGIALTASVMGAGLSLYAAYEEAQNYALASAATGTDFDKAKAISQEDPSMLWLAIDIVGAVLDVYGAAAAFKALRTALQATKARGIAGMPELIGAARRARLSPATQGRLIAEAMGGAGKVDETVKSIRQIYRNLPRPSADERLAEAFGYAAERLFNERKVVVVPAEKGAQKKILMELAQEHGSRPNAKRIAEYLMHELEGAHGYLDRDMGVIILKGDSSSSSVATFLAHELGHHRQDLLIGIENMGRFESEFQAIVAEREFMKLLPPEQVKTLLPEHLEILHASDQGIAKIAGELYPDLPQPPGFNPEASADLILKALRGK